jgi:hypothetical protein
VAATDCWYEDSIWVRAARVAASIVCVVVANAAVICARAAAAEPWA